MRVGEALKLDWCQLDWSQGDHGVIKLEGAQAKNKQWRYVPVPSQVAMMVRKVENQTGPTFDGTNLRNEWERACAAVGEGTRVKMVAESLPGAKLKRKHVWHQYDGLLVHDLRRSAARNMRAAGVPESVIMAIGGWKTRAVFDRYAIVSTDDVVTAMRKVEGVSGKELGKAQLAISGHKVKIS
jgi:integrase